MSQEPGDLEQLRAELRAATKEWETAVAELAAYLRSGSARCDTLPSSVYHREVAARVAVKQATRKLEECRLSSQSQ